MREIIFRGKRIDNGEWVQAANIIHFNDEGIEQHYYIPKYNETCVCTHDESDNIVCVDRGTFYKVIPETVGQYSGLTDKNGTKIFEGDIVRLPYPEHIENFVCFWDDCNIEFGLKNEKESFGLAYASRDIEVIGNIHDNPELLGGIGE